MVLSVSLYYTNNLTFVSLCLCRQASLNEAAERQYERAARLRPDVSPLNPLFLYHCVVSLYNIKQTHLLGYGGSWVQHPRLRKSRSPPSCFCRVSISHIKAKGYGGLCSR